MGDADEALGGQSTPAFVPSQTSAAAPWQLCRFEDCFVELNPFGMPTLASVYMPFRNDVDNDEEFAEKRRRSAGLTLGMRAHPPLGECVKCVVLNALSWKRGSATMLPGQQVTFPAVLEAW